MKIELNWLKIILLSLFISILIVPLFTFIITIAHRFFINDNTVILFFPNNTEIKNLTEIVALLTTLSITIFIFLFNRNKESEIQKNYEMQSRTNRTLESFNNTIKQNLENRKERKILGSDVGTLMGDYIENIVMYKNCSHNCQININKCYFTLNLKLKDIPLAEKLLKKLKLIHNKYENIKDEDIKELEDLTEKFIVDYTKP